MALNQVKEEVEELLPRSVYFLGSRKEEPPNFSYLHEKSVVRAVMDCIQTKPQGSLTLQSCESFLLELIYPSFIRNLLYLST